MNNTRTYRHPVYRKDKSTTKIRPVFDGAAKTKFGTSLNEVLETGPNLNTIHNLNTCIHLQSVQSRYPETVNQLIEQLYVDDYLGGTENFESAKKRVTETNIIFSEERLNMRSYATNCEELRQILEDKGLENQIVGLLSLIRESAEGAEDSMGYQIRQLPVRAIINSQISRRSRRCDYEKENSEHLR